MAVEERTEEPTSKRLSEARRKGQVAMSRELNVAALLIIATLLLGAPGRLLLLKISEVMVYALTHLTITEPTVNWLVGIILMTALAVAPYLGLIVLGLLVTGVTVTIMQTGFLWASDKLGFDLNRINPLNGFKRLFSTQGLVEVLKAVIKLLVVGWVAYSFIKSHVLDVLGMGQVDMLTALAHWAKMALALFLRVGEVYLIFAFADYLYQRRTTKQSLKMTKEEVKEEYKQTEGNPQIKSAIRAKQRRLARMRMMARVPKADVVITNPTHLAIAIQYLPDEMNAPVVVAKGAYKIAERIIEIARQNDVVITENVPLARALYRLVEVDMEIPPEFYVAVAEVLAYVYRIKRKVFKKAV